MNTGCGEEGSGLKAYLYLEGAGDLPGGYPGHQCGAEVRGRSWSSVVGDMEVFVLIGMLTRNVKQEGLSLQRERYITCFLLRRLGKEVINGLLTSVLSVWPGLMSSYRF